MILTHKEWERILKTINDYLARVLNELGNIKNTMNVELGFQRMHNIFQQNIILHRKKQLEMLERELKPIREKLLIYVEFDKLIKKVVAEKKTSTLGWSKEETRCLEILMTFKSDREIGLILKRSKTSVKDKRERLQRNPLVNLK